MSTRIGTLLGDNGNGTVVIDLGGAQLANVPCSPAYTPRKVGDRVAVEVDGGTMWVTGRTSGVAGSALVATSAPGSPFTAASVYVDPSTGELRYVVTPPAAPVSGSTGKSGRVVLSATGLRTYRDGRIQMDGTARQGSWYGYGPDTGISVHSAALWASLDGKTVTKAQVRLRRADNGAGVWSAQEVQVGWHSATSLPDTPPTINEPTIVGALANGQDATFPLPASHVTSARAARGGLGINGPAWVELDLIEILVDWSD